MTEEELSLLLQKRSERLGRMYPGDDGATDEDGASVPDQGNPRYVSNHEFFTATFGQNLATPNAQCFKRIQVVQ
jgi:hypothetical protein